MLVLGWNRYLREKEKNDLNSSQGRAKRTIRLPVRSRWKRRNTGNSSILFFSLFTLLECLTGSTLLVSAQKTMEMQYREVGDAFEAMMLQHFYRQLKESSRTLQVGDENPFAPSNAELIFESMRDDIVIGKMAGSRPLGISDMVVKQLKGSNSK